MKGSSGRCGCATCADGQRRQKPFGFRRTGSLSAGRGIFGFDFRDWLEEWTEDYKTDLQEELDEARATAKEAETELDALKNHQRQVFTEVYEEADRLMSLTIEDHPDTSEIHCLAEKIWDVISNEL